MPGASLALFADLGACHVQKSSVTICVLPALPVKRYRRSISIHALRVKGDPALFRLPISFPNFYPRPPGGGRHKEVSGVDVDGYFYPRPPGGGRPARKTACSGARPLFLSTPSGWRATSVRGYSSSTAIFLSTPSGWRATTYANFLRSCAAYFYPRPPGGGRPRLPPCSKGR